MSKLSEADVIWAEIKDLPLSIFGLPNQTVSKHVRPVTVDGVSLYVKFDSPAVLPALDDALNTVMDSSGNVTKNERFSIERSFDFFLIKRTTKVPAFEDPAVLKAKDFFVSTKPAK